MPWRHSFFGFAGPVDGARGELTRQDAPLFPRFETKRVARGRMQKKPRALGAARGEVGGLRGVAIATQRYDSATPSFIPPLNNNEERPGSRPLLAALRRAAEAPDGLRFESSIVARKVKSGSTIAFSFRFTEKSSSPAGNNRPPVGVFRSDAKLVNRRREPSARRAPGTHPEVPVSAFEVMRRASPGVFGAIALTRARIRRTSARFSGCHRPSARALGAGAAGTSGRPARNVS
jgi:hypothetical protein